MSTYSDLIARLDRPAQASRTRAPKRTGHRTQLTVPGDQWDQAVALAAAAGTTPNDVLVMLAAAALEQVNERRRLNELATERVNALFAASSDWSPESVSAPAAFEDYERAVRAMAEDDA